MKERILALAVEKTGYPRDMLDLDLDLEADLGVDTVKQAEMFAAIREIYNIPRDENRKLRDYPTLAHVIRFVYEKRPDLAGAPPLAAVSSATGRKSKPRQQHLPAIAAAKGSADQAVKERILALRWRRLATRRDMLDLDLDLEADLGVDTVKQAEMFAAIREIYNIPRDENRKLRDYPTLAHVIRFVYEKRPDLAVRLRRGDGKGNDRGQACYGTSCGGSRKLPRRLRNASLPSPWRRLATQETCWIWISISKPISGLTL